MADAAIVYSIEELSAMVDNIILGVNISFVFINGVIVFFMQAGFAFLEAGSVRAKNTNHILMKNALDTALGIMAFWMFGYAFLNGSVSNQFIGTAGFFLSDVPIARYCDFFYQLVYATASTTIVSGAMAERGVVWSYGIYAIIMTGVIYPIAAHWAFCTGGWLFINGFHDKSGSTVIHTCGGAAALVGAVLLGPRIGRFGAKRKVINIPGHSTALTSLGFFILWFGFLCFNGMADGGVVGSFNQNVVSTAVIDTILAGSGGLLSALLLSKIGFGKGDWHFFYRKVNIWTPLNRSWSLCEAINGSLAGCVAACAGCDVLTPWGGFVNGLGAGVTYVIVAKIILFIRVDDPLNAIAVHWGGGAWGTIFLAFILPSDRLEIAPNGGIFYAWDGDAFKFWGIQMMGNAVIALWAIVCTTIVFGIFKILGILRVSKEEELKGLDNAHGELAYPSDPFANGVPDVESDESDPQNE